jgi:LPXTG-motif cell wall-anchored protein
MNGWLMWGLILPVLLIVAGIVSLRRRNHRR